MYRYINGGYFTATRTYVICLFLLSAGFAESRGRINGKMIANKKDKLDDLGALIEEAINLTL